jgi:protein SCO1/2
MSTAAKIITFAVALGLTGGPLAVAQESRPQHHHLEMPAADVIASDSLYQLPMQIQMSDGRTLNLADLRGKPLIVTMFYTHCTSVCPLITAQVKSLVGNLTPAERQQITILMVSLDALRDTPEVLTDFKVERHIQDSNWFVARTSASDARALAAALGIRYRELPDHTFNHSAIISVTDANGVVRARTSQMTGPDPEFLTAVRAQITASSGIDRD